MTATLPAAPVRPRQQQARSYGGTVLAVVVLVVLVDQLLKAWAWRTLTDVHINAGGNPFTGATLGTALTDTTHGAVLDVVNATLLAAAAWLLVRYCRSPAIAVTGGALLAGWVSNIGDRLGLHYVTAPCSVRGVVDFVPFGGHYWNLADVVIMFGAVAFVLAATGTVARSLVRRPAVRLRPPQRWPLVASFLIATCGFAAVCVFAALGTVAIGSLDGPDSYASL